MESGRMGRVWQFPYLTNSKVWEFCPYINDRYLDIIMVGVGIREQKLLTVICFVYMHSI